MNNLYTVTVETVLVVAAESQEKATEIAMAEVYCDGTTQDVTDVSLILTEADLPVGWDTHSLPYQDEEDNEPEYSIGHLLYGKVSVE